MPAEPLFDYSNTDFDRPMADVEAVKKINPHRGEMIQINGVASWTDDYAQGVGWRDVRDDEFWVPAALLPPEAFWTSSWQESMSCRRCS